MENPLNKIERIAARARREDTPTVDVVAQVLYRLSHREEFSNRPLVIFAVASLATAVLMVVLSLSLYNTITDPLWTLFQVLPITGQ